jgi:hypothetical protein
MGNLGEELEEFENEKAIQQDIRSIAENIRELLGAIYIQEMRNYDMLSIMADKLGADAKGLSSLHEQGQVLAPPASFVFNDESEENDNPDI